MRSSFVRREARTGSTVRSLLVDWGHVLTGAYGN